MLAEFSDRDGPQHAQQVRDLLCGLRAALRGATLQLGVDLRDDLWIEQFAQLHRAQQLREQRRVKR